VSSLKAAPALAIPYLSIDFSRKTVYLVGDHISYVISITDFPSYSSLIRNAAMSVSPLHSIVFQLRHGEICKDMNVRLHRYS